jgi:hypothetical protein
MKGITDSYSAQQYLKVLISHTYIKTRCDDIGNLPKFDKVIPPFTSASYN